MGLADEILDVIIAEAIPNRHKQHIFLQQTFPEIATVKSQQRIGIDYLSLPPTDHQQRRSIVPFAGVPRRGTMQFDDGLQILNDDRFCANRGQYTLINKFQHPLPTTHWLSTRRGHQTWPLNTIPSSPVGQLDARIV